MHAGVRTADAASPCRSHLAGDGERCSTDSGEVSVSCQHSSFVSIATQLVWFERHLAPTARVSPRLVGRRGQTPGAGGGGQTPGAGGGGQTPGAGGGGQTPGAGGGGSDPGRGGRGSDPGRGGRGSDPGRGGRGSDPGRGGRGSDPGRGGGGSDPGRGGRGVRPRHLRARQARWRATSE